MFVSMQILVFMTNECEVDNGNFSLTPSKHLPLRRYIYGNHDIKSTINIKNMTINSSYMSIFW